MSFMDCYNCGNSMLDDNDCLDRAQGYQDDVYLADNFRDYYMQLWKCPKCNWHRLIIQVDNLRAGVGPARNCILFDSGFKPRKLHKKNI